MCYNITMEEKFVEMSLTPVNLKSNNIGEIIELTFNIGGVFCPISTLLGLGVGAYNKKLAQDNLDLLASSLNNLIHNQDFLLKRLKKLEKENQRLCNVVYKCNDKIEETASNLVNQEQVIINIKEKTEDELRSFSFNLQDIINTTIKEKSKVKIEKYSEYIVKTILDDVIFSPGDKFKYIRNVIKSLSKNDVDVLIFMDKQNCNVYDGQFSNIHDGKYSVELDDFLSIQKLIKLGLVEFETEFFVPDRYLIEEGVRLPVDKSYCLTSFYYSIKKYLYK